MSLQVGPRTITALVGPNGAGKTTLLKAVMGYVPPTSGRILFGGQAITSSPTHRTVGLGLGYVPQGRIVFPHMTVQENLMMGLYPRRTDRALRSRAFDLVYSVFPRLHERRWQHAGTLSGGEQQMLAIARALMARPKILLVDEPCLGLAPIMVKAVFEALREIRNRGITILLVEQNVWKSLEFSERGYVMENGRIVHRGASGHLLADDKIRRAYLGL